MEDTGIHRSYHQVKFCRGGGSIFKYSDGSNVLLPVNSWVTIEVYIDYGSSTIYFSIPVLNNYTVMYQMQDLYFGGTDTEGNPLPDRSEERRVGKECRCGG